MCFAEISWCGRGLLILQKKETLNLYTCVYIYNPWCRHPFCLLQINSQKLKNWLRKCKNHKRTEIIRQHKKVEMKFVLKPLAVPQSPQKGENSKPMLFLWLRSILVKTTDLEAQQKKLNQAYLWQLNTSIFIHVKLLHELLHLFSECGVWRVLENAQTFQKSEF